MEQILVSRLDAAKALSISVRNLDYMIAQGKIPARKLGKRTLIPRVALEKFARSPETAGNGGGQ
ncbi:MAG: helix-turn-helix domain-containing protein [Acidobacteria bacterium]|nr:helix-turn-helix domain-containing protein [Acidobacteriota bacterium]